MRTRLNVSVAPIVISSVLICSICCGAAQAASTDEANGTTSANADGNNGTEAKIGTMMTGALGANIGQFGSVTGHASTPSQTANELPFTSNEGTLAESANTTALSTSTYNQPTGILPGWRCAPF